MEGRNLENLRLVARAKSGNDAAISSLAESHLPAFRGLLARFGEVPPGEFPALVWRAAETYRGGLSSFPSWLGWCVKSRCMNARSSERRFQCSKELFFHPIEFPSPGWSGIDAGTALELLSSHPDKRAAPVVKLKYWEDMTYREIGKKIGFSHETAKRIHDRAVEWLRKQIL